MVQGGVNSPEMCDFRKSKACPVTVEVNSAALKQEENVCYIMQGLGLAFSLVGEC